MLSLPLIAADLPPGKWWRRPEVVNQLGLTEEQQSRLEGIFRTAATVLIDARADVDKLQVAIGSEIDQPQLNRANLQRLANELSTARGKLFEREIMMLADMRGVLNEQQWTKLRAHLDRMRENRQPGQKRPK
jgi:Spy/CpxP family protein refolding chaperone